MIIRFPHEFPWGDRTNFEQKIYVSLDEKYNKHFYYGVMKSMGLTETPEDLQAYIPKTHHLLSPKPPGRPGELLDFISVKNGIERRFCPRTEFRADRLFYYDGDRLFIDDQEIDLGEFYSSEGFDSVEQFKRFYPAKMRGLLVEWGEWVHNIEYE